MTLRALGPGLALALAVLPASSLAQTLDEVVAKYTAARGGLERWRAVRAMEVKGDFTSFSIEAPFTLVRKRPDRYHMESDSLRGHFVQATDATGPWHIFPAYGIDWPQRAGGPDANQIAREAQFEPALMDYKAKGHTAELAGRGDVDGQETVAVKLTLKGGQVETWHLDPKTGLEVAVDSMVFDFTQRGDAMPQRTYFSDFRPVGGLVLPHRIEKEYGARHVVVAVEQFRLDPDLPEERFRMPLPEGMEALRPLAGEWDMKLELRQDPRAEFETVATTSTITPFYEGALLDERFTYTQGGSKNEVVRTRSFDRFGGRYRFTHFDGSTGHLNVLEGGKAEAGKVIASNEKTGTSWKIGDTTVHERQTIYDVTADGFKVDWELSTDAGKTWFTAARHTYTRRRSG